MESFTLTGPVSDCTGQLNKHYGMDVGREHQRLFVHWEHCTMSVCGEQCKRFGHEECWEMPGISLGCPSKRNSVQYLCAGNRGLSVCGKQFEMPFNGEECRMPVLGGGTMWDVHLRGTPWVDCLREREMSVSREWCGMSIHREQCVCLGNRGRCVSTGNRVVGLSVKNSV